MVGVLTARLPFPGPRRAWDLYCLNLQKRPILTKSFTSLLGFAIGDAVAQLSNRPSSRDRETQPWGYASRLLSLVHLSVPECRRAVDHCALLKPVSPFCGCHHAYNTKYVLFVWTR